MPFSLNKYRAFEIELNELPNCVVVWEMLVKLHLELILYSPSLLYMLAQYFCALQLTKRNHLIYLNSKNLFSVYH